MSQVNEQEEDSMIDHPTAPTSNLLPQKKTVKAWHMPRKHWVRLHQWNAQIALLIDQIRVGNENNLSYLSLPGTDLLDVRTVLELCNSKKITLKFLGFNDPVRELPEDITSLNISEAELKKQPNVHPRSQVVLDTLEKLSDTTSTAHKALLEFGTADVINLDLTNCVAQAMPNEVQENYYRAIHELIEHQRDKRMTPFLFFLTTRLNAEQLNRGAFGMFLKVLGENYRQHSSFAEKMATCFGIPLKYIDAAERDAGFGVIANCLHTVFSVAFGKWLLKLLLRGKPQWTIEMLESCAYMVHPGPEPDMFSYAFICRPALQRGFDTSGLSTQVKAPTSQAVDPEVIFAEKLVDAVDAIFDLDRYMLDDKNMRQELVEQATELMKQANYDPEVYKVKANTQLQKVAKWIENADRVAV